MTVTTNPAIAAPTTEPGSRNKRSVWHVIAATVAAGALAAAGLAAAVYTNPCHSEGDDSQVACYWDASEQGNRVGTDFVNIGYGRLVVNIG